MSYAAECEAWASAARAPTTREPHLCWLAAIAALIRWAGS